MKRGRAMAREEWWQCRFPIHLQPQAGMKAWEPSQAWLAVRTQVAPTLNWIVMRCNG
jgi:hypothetical protein